MESHPHYEILDEIGHGQAATVFRARDLNLKRFVAIKALHDKLRQDPRQMEHFWEEAQFLANLEHENVVKVFGIEKKQGWIILELMRGSLDVKLAEGPLPYDLVRSVLSQTLEGLKYLHENGKLHGAIKPANLLINDQGRVKLSDSAGNALGGEIRKPKGSYKYLAPELLNPVFGEVSPAVDLYCAGFTALELLQGPKFNDLFDGVGAGAVDPELGWMRWHSSPTELLPSLKKIIPDLPPDLSEVIGRLLEKQVGDRYSSAEEALNDLKQLPIISVELPGDATGVPKTKVEQVGGADVPVRAETRIEAENRPVKPKPKPKPGGGSPPPWSRLWINKKLEDKRVLAAVCAVVIIPALIFMFWPDDPPEKTKVSISSTPPGAEVFLDGNKAKKTTNNDFSLSPGSHKVRLSLAGYRDKEEVIEVKAGTEKQTLQLTLEPETRKVAIKSNPAGAEIYLDGQAKGMRTEAVLELTGGKSYQLRLSKAGYRDLNKEIAVPVGTGDYMLDPFNLVENKGSGNATNQRDPRRFALLVGVRQSAGGLPEYDFADTDVNSLRHVLTRAGYQERDIVVLKENATAANIRDSLRALAADKIAADAVLVLLSGQGVQAADGACFCPVQGDPAVRGSLLGLQEVFTELTNCQAGLKLLLIDACRGGQGIVPETSGQPPDGLACFFGSSAGQQSFRRLDWPHSVFMHAVIRAFSGEADVDANRQISVDELKAFVQAKVKEYAGKEYSTQPGQSPQMIGRTSDFQSLSTADGVLRAYARGCRRMETRDYKGALADFEEAINLDRSFVPALLQRASANYYTGAYNDAIRDCDAAIGLDRQNAEAYVIRGEVALKVNRPEEAIADLTKALAAVANYPAALATRGSAYREKKDKEFGLALADFDNAIRLAPFDPYIHNMRGNTYYRQGIWEKAKQDYETANKLNRNFYSACDNLAKVYDKDKLNDPVQAQKWRDEANRIKPLTPRP